VKRFKNDKLEDGPGPGGYYNEQLSDFHIKDKDPNFYFKNPTQKEENLVEKYFKSKEEMNKKFSIPGVGAYNLRGNIGKSYENNLRYQIEKINNYSPKRNDDHLPSLRTDFYDLKSSIDGKSVTSVFNSKSPKLMKNKKSILPGPAFYKPSVMPKKFNFNFNINDGWI